MGGQAFLTVSGIRERLRADARGTIAAAARPHLAMINQAPVAICWAVDERAVQQLRRFTLASPIPNAARRVRAGFIALRRDGAGRCCA